MSDEELKTSDEPEVTDDGDDDAIEEFDPSLVTAAKSVGLNPDNFDSEDDLYSETEILVAKRETSALPAQPVDEKDEALQMAALEIVLSAKGEEELDPEIVTNLRAIAKASGENFGKLVERLTSNNDVTAQLRGEVKQLLGAVQNLNAQNIQLGLDNWIRSHDEVQVYLGKSPTGDLEEDGKFARRRRSLVRKAHNIARHQKGTFTAEQMFGKSFKKMQKPGTEKTKGKKSEKTEDTEPTRLARASGTTTSDLVGGDSSEAAMKAKATSVVAKARRNSR